jgi:Flp pilus assembly protein TadG
LALLIAPLCLLLFGIVVYGFLMSFRQNMTSAAAEGARAGAIAPPDNSPNTHALALAQAKDATEKALGSFGESCGTLVSSTASSTRWTNSRTTCLFTVSTCPAPSTFKCMIAEVDYDYEGHPLMPDVPIVSNAIPSTFTSQSTAQINQ